MHTVHIFSRVCIWSATSSSSSISTPLDSYADDDIPGPSSSAWYSFPLFSACTSSPSATSSMPNLTVTAAHATDQTWPSRSLNYHRSRTGCLYLRLRHPGKVSKCWNVRSHLGCRGSGKPGQQSPHSAVPASAPIVFARVLTAFLIYIHPTPFRCERGKVGLDLLLSQHPPPCSFFRSPKNWVPSESSFSDIIVRHFAALTLISLPREPLTPFSNCSFRKAIWYLVF